MGNANTKGAIRGNNDVEALRDRDGDVTIREPIAKGSVLNFTCRNLAIDGSIIGNSCKINVRSTGDVIVTNYLDNDSSITIQQCKSMHVAGSIGRTLGQKGIRLEVHDCTGNFTVDGKIDGCSNVKVTCQGRATFRDRIDYFSNVSVRNSSLLTIKDRIDCGSEVTSSDCGAVTIGGRIDGAVLRGGKLRVRNCAGHVKVGDKMSGWSEVDIECRSFEGSWLTMQTKFILSYVDSFRLESEFGHFGVKEIVQRVIVAQPIDDPVAAGGSPVRNAAGAAVNHPHDERSMQQEPSQRNNDSAGGSSAAAVAALQNIILLLSVMVALLAVGMIYLLSK